MRNGIFLAGLTFLLAGQGLAIAQHAARYTSTGAKAIGGQAATSLWTTDSLSDGFDLEMASDVCTCEGSESVKSSSFRISGEYLLWWFKDGRIPPLVTANGDGILGSPGVGVLVDNLDFDDRVRQGGRFAIAYGSGESPFGIEANYFFVSARTSGISFSSDGDPVLAQPFMNAITGMPDATLVASPGIATGSITIEARTSLWGTEANLTGSVVRSDRFHLTALAGFRFLRLGDNVQSRQQFEVAADVPGFGGNRVTVHDEFRTLNNFYGGQLGLVSGWQLGIVRLDLRFKMALGQMDQVGEVNGITSALDPTGSRSIFQGGLYALRSNIGRHEQDVFAFVPEIGLDVGVQLTRNVKVRGGYTFLWIDSVARAGEQIDSSVNVTQFPIRSGDGPLVGPVRPAFDFKESDFWAQGLYVGLELGF